jgi:hypothetical protein
MSVEAAVDILDADDVEEDEDQLPVNFAILTADGKVWDLREPNTVNDLVEHMSQLRQKMRDGTLDDYEGRSTDWGKGGRSRLLYDEVRGHLAQDYHEGKTGLTWEQQNQEAMKKVKIVAVMNRARWS